MEAGWGAKNEKSANTQILGEDYDNRIFQLPGPRPEILGALGSNCKCSLLCKYAWCAVLLKIDPTFRRTNLRSYIMTVHLIIPRSLKFSPLLKPKKVSKSPRDPFFI